MVFEFKFPDVGEGIHEGILIKWLVKEGDKVKEDQPLAEVETDKAVVELPAPKAGTILKLHAKEKDTLHLGQVIVSFGEEGESLPKTVAGKDLDTEILRPKKHDLEPTPKITEKIEKAFEAKQVETISKPIPQPMPATVGAPAKEVKATPATRKLARELGVQIELIQGTGPNERITDEDVRQAVNRSSKTFSQSPSMPAFQPIQSSVPEGQEQRIPFKGIRKVIAENMIKSKFTIPEAVQIDEADVTRLVELRTREKEEAAKKGIHLTFLPFIIKAVIQALKKYPKFNSSLDEEKQEIVLKGFYHLGIATDTVEGLMVTVIKNADKKSILELAKELQELTEKARTRKISLQELHGQTFTITNVGSLGGTISIPIINKPDAAILGIGTFKKVVKVMPDNSIATRTITVLSLPFDHRIVDGAEAARFVTEIIKFLENPDLLLLGL